MMNPTGGGEEAAAFYGQGKEGAERPRDAGGLARAGSLMWRDPSSGRVKPQTLVTAGSFVGALLVLAAYYDAAARGDEAAVRGAWMDVAPQLCALLALAGVAYARRRADRQAQGLALANAALTALLTHLVLVFMAPLRAEEPAISRLWAALDIAGLFLVPFAVLILTQRPMRLPTLVRAVQLLAVLAALVSARQAANLVTGFTPLRLVGAALALIAMVASVRVAQRLVPRKRRGSATANR